MKGSGKEALGNEERVEKRMSVGRVAGDWWMADGGWQMTDGTELESFVLGCG